MKLFIDIVIKRIYLFHILAWNYRKKIGFPVCKKENFASLQAHRKHGKSARASPTPHHTLNEERSARFTAQPLSALLQLVSPAKRRLKNKRRNSILTTRHYPDLGSAFDRWNQISHVARPIRSNYTQIWVVTRYQYGISALVSQGLT